MRRIRYSVEVGVAVVIRSTVVARTLNAVLTQEKHDQGHHVTRMSILGLSQLSVAVICPTLACTEKIRVAVVA